MLARVLSAALSALAPKSATAEVNGIEAFPVEVEVNTGWGDTTVALITSISPISCPPFLVPEIPRCYPVQSEDSCGQNLLKLGTQVPL
jgi:hypothetical protein